MSFRRASFLNFVAAVEALLLVWILSLAVFKPKPEPIILGKAEVIPQTGVSAVAALRPPAQESADVKGGVDAGHRIGKYLKIRGWAFVQNRQTKGQRVYVQLKKLDGTLVHYTTLPMERSDIGTRFKNPLYSDCGFTGLIPVTDGLDLDGRAIRLLVENKGEMYKSTPITLQGIS